MSGYLLEAKEICAGYGFGDVVKNVSFYLNAGENLSIIGPNGCGKTTLLKALANILPFRGEAVIDGLSYKKMSHKDISLKIAMLSQSSGIYFTYTVYDTVMMGRYLHIKEKFLASPTAADKEYVYKCLEAVNLLKEKDREITRLSGGQLQRVFLARALAQEPDIILLDEPTNHLDLKYQIELIEYLKQWAGKGKRGVIGVLHDINLAVRLGGNLLVLKDGASLAFGKTNDIISGGLLKEAYEIDVVGYMRESFKRWENVN